MLNNISILFCRNKEEFKKIGFDTGQSQTPITPVMLFNEDLARQFSHKLFEQGVFATPIVFPMVAQGKARIRTMPTAAHSKDDLNEALSKIEKVGKYLKVI